MSTARIDAIHQIQTSETDTTKVLTPDGVDGVQWATAPGSDGQHTHIVGEAMVGDGVTTVFYLANEAQTDEVAAYSAGLRLAVTLGGMNDTITFGSAPGNGDAILVDYIPVL